MEEIKEQLLENNKQTYWVPDYVKVRTVFLHLFLLLVVLVFHYEMMVCLIRKFIFGVKCCILPLLILVFLSL